MTDFGIYTHSPTPSECNTAEILRYMGLGINASADEYAAALSLAETLLENVIRKITARACYGVFPIKPLQNGVEFFFGIACSQDLKNHLENCTHALVFAATLGMEFDRELAKQSAISKANALAMQAIGAELAEKLCDGFEREISKKHHLCTTRFSPGYGDLPTQFQREIFTALGCRSHIGLTLGASFVMSPSKSVSAIVGIK